MSFLAHALNTIQVMGFSLSRGLASMVVLSCLAIPSAFAVTYSDNGDDTVTDPGTGLTWMRCAMGQTWDGSSCTGTSSSYNWDQANALTGAVTFAGNSDWRLPNIRELGTIVNRSAYGPATDSAAFPGPPCCLNLWSASADAYHSGYAWYLSLIWGDVVFALKDETRSVRMVRAGQSPGLLNVARPTPDYVDHGDGTVTHTPTGLMWKRCAEGQIWDGSSCGGSPGNYDWFAATLLGSAYAGNTDWRLPTVYELLTLVDYTRSSPAMNSTVFPGISASTFWSASRHVDPHYALVVAFDNGGMSQPGVFASFPVRLVRAGQSLGSSTSTTTTTSTSTTASTAGAPTTTTTVAGVTTTTQGGSSVATALNLVSGWNLMGNGSTGALDVSAVLGDTTKINAVWKWIAGSAKWAFYTPSLPGQALSDYATGKGYDVLATINGGEGFWVNAKAAFSAQLPAGAAIPSTSFQTIASGWSLIAIGDGKTPSQFNQLLGAAPSVQGVIPINLTTLWAWDTVQTNWYFYAPSLEKSGGLASHIASKNYLDFGARLLDPTTGFWVNMPDRSTTATNPSSTTTTTDNWSTTVIGTATGNLTFTAAFSPAHPRAGETITFRFLKDDADASIGYVCGNWSYGDPADGRLDYIPCPGRGFLCDPKATYQAVHDRREWTTTKIYANPGTYKAYFSTRSGDANGCNPFGDDAELSVEIVVGP